VFFFFFGSSSSSSSSLLYTSKMVCVCGKWRACCNPPSYHRLGSALRRQTQGDQGLVRPLTSKGNEKGGWRTSLSTRKKKKKKKKKDDALFYRPDPAHALRRDRARASHPSGPKNQKKKKKKKNWQTKEIFSRPRNKRKSLPTKHKEKWKKTNKKNKREKIELLFTPHSFFFSSYPDQIKSSRQISVSFLLLPSLQSKFFFFFLSFSSS
jgi:hypothetical protein